MRTLSQASADLDSLTDSKTIHAETMKVSVDVDFVIKKTVDGAYYTFRKNKDGWYHSTCYEFDAGTDDIDAIAEIQCAIRSEVSDI